MIVGKSWQCSDAITYTDIRKYTGTIAIKDNWLFLVAYQDLTGRGGC